MSTRTALLFPGQGAQYVGMGAHLAATVPEAKSLFERANEILGYDLLALCSAGPAEELNSTVRSQPALFVCSLAALQQLEQTAPEAVRNCVYAAGLSLGEYTALVFAGALDFEEGLKLVQLRGAAMQQAADREPSGMVSVLGIEPPQLDQLCNEARQGQVLQIANLLCPGNIVVSGHAAACQRLATAAEAAGAMKVVPLSVAGAFHTPLMQPAVERLRVALSHAAFSTPRIPVVSNVDAQPHSEPEKMRELLERQVVAPVQWEASMRWLLGEGKVEMCYEVGPGKVLRSLLKRIERRFPCAGIEA